MRVFTAVQFTSEKAKEYYNGSLEYATEHSAAIDLRACIDSPIRVSVFNQVLIPTGIKIAIVSDPTTPPVAAFIVPRSGRAIKEGLVLGNSLGLVDNDFRGCIKVSVWNRPISRDHAKRSIESLPLIDTDGTFHHPNPPTDDIVIEPGERIAQMYFQVVERPIFKYVDEDEFERDYFTQRGSGGFGSTGNT
jgi:dUTP pyrophosphatase